MASHRRVDRRLFLSQLGRRTMAATLLGTGVVACSSSSNGDTVTETTVRSTTTRSGDVETSVTEETARGDDLTTEPGEALRWSVASFDFVSAYVLARGSRVTVVDTGTSGGIDRFDPAFAALGVDWASVEHVVLTHLHGDHVGGLGDVLENAPTAMAYAGAADIGGITSPRPLTAIDGGDEVQGLRIIATPGHTAGHVSVLDPDSGVFVAGDALNTTAGAVEGPNPRFTADLSMANASVRQLASLTISTVLPGHGPPVEDAGPLIAALASSL